MLEGRGAVAELDPVAAASTLGLGPVRQSTVLARNRGKAVWRLDTGAGPVALRVLRAGEGEVARHEARMMDVARSGGIPVPSVDAVREVAGHPVMVLSWCAGTTARAVLRRRPWAARRVGLACGRAQAGLHAVPPPDQPAAWVDRLGVVDGALRAAVRAVGGTPAVLHLDLHPDNVLLDGGRVSAVLDWTNATTGDPRADLARTWALLVVAPTGRGPAALVAQAVDRVLARAWRTGYEQVAGPVGHHDLFRAWAAAGLLATLPEDADPRRRRVLTRRTRRLRRRAGLPAD